MQFDHLRPRSINQDALENAFGGIRSYCGDNDNPSASQFVSSLKTHIINGLTLTNRSIHNTNSETDESELLSNFFSYLQSTSPSIVQNVEHLGQQEVTQDCIDNTEMASFNPDILNLGSADVYVSGFIAKKLLQLGNSECNLCSTLLKSDSNSWVEDFMTFKEYDRNITNSLIYPTEALVHVVSQATNIAETTLEREGHIVGIGQQIKREIESKIDFSWYVCEDHKEAVVKGILRAVCFICIPWYCTRQNRSFKLTALRFPRRLAKQLFCNINNCSRCVRFYFFYALKFI